ncbi:18458_t:CDS:2, partial [Racocetra persica]
LLLLKNGEQKYRDLHNYGNNRNTSLWHCKKENYEIPIRNANESEWLL